MSITPIDAAAQIKRLVAAGYRAPEVPADELARSWVEHLGDLNRDDVAEAVSRYIRDDAPHWPKPGKIRWWVTEITRGRPARQSKHLDSGDLAKRYSAWERHQDHGTTHPDGRCVVCAAGCPVCGAVLQWVPTSEHAPPSAATGYRHVYAVLHDAREHVRQGIPWAGYPLPEWAREMYAGREVRRTGEAAD